MDDPGDHVRTAWSDLNDLNTVETFGGLSVEDMPASVILVYSYAIYRAHWRRERRKEESARFKFRITLRKEIVCEYKF